MLPQTIVNALQEHTGLEQTVSPAQAAEYSIILQSFVDALIIQDGMDILVSK